MRKLFIFLLLLACVAAYGQAISKDLIPAVGSGELSPVKFGGKKLPSWLNSEYSPIFNGVNQYAITPSIAWPTSSGAFSWMCWAKRFELGITGTKIIWKGKTNADGRVMIYTNNTGNVFIGNTSGTAYSRAQALGANSIWTHLAYVSAPGSPLSSGTFFENGVPLAWAAQVGATSSAFVGVADEYLVGGIYATNGFNGGLAEMSLWNKTLTQSEILRYKDKRLKGTETGLVALYHMSDNSQTLVDSVGGKNAVASNSITWTKRNGYAAPDVRSERYALSFDGVDDIALGTQTAITAYPFTLEGWTFTPTLAVNKSTCPISIGGAANGYYCLNIYNLAGVYKATFQKNNVSIYIDTTGLLGKWSHLALVNETSSFSRCFLNGVEVSSITTDVPFRATVNVGVGGMKISTTNYYSFGKAAECRIWNTARTQAEIQSNLYTQMTGSETGLVYYYRGSEGTGTILTNLGSAGAAGNLTLYLGPTWVGRDIP